MRGLKRLERPRAPRGLAPDVRDIWRALAPQIARRCEVTALDITELAALCTVADRVQRLEAEMTRHTGRIRRQLKRLHRENRGLLWEMCQEFLLGPEVLEEITAPDGRTLADLIGAGSGSAEKSGAR